MKKLISYITLRKISAIYPDKDKKMVVFYRRFFGQIFKKHGRWSRESVRCIKPITTSKK